MPKKESKKTKAAKSGCSEKGCKTTPSNEGYCRKHYILNWKHIRFSRQVKAEKRLNAYVDKLVEKYPEDYLDKIKENLENEEEFKKTVEALDSDGEESETEREYIEKLGRNFKVGE